MYKVIRLINLFTIYHYLYVLSDSNDNKEKFVSGNFHLYHYIFQG
jgi:hypothetical protein